MSRSTATPHRPARLLPPFHFSTIFLAMNYAVASKPAASIVEPIEINASTAPKNEPAEPDVKPGAHFAGLLEPVRMAEMTEVAEEEAGDDDEARAGGRMGDRGLLGMVVAKRLIAARLLNGYSQNEAASLSGYSNGSQLSLWEAGRRPPPLVPLVQFADAMNVSLDYLLGRSDDPERDVRLVRQNACIRAVRATLVGAVERVVDAFDSDESIVGLNIGMVRDLASAAEAVTATYGDFVQQHRAGRANVAERLASAVDRMGSAALKVGIALRRHDDEDVRMKQRLAEIAANDPN